MKLDQVKGGVLVRVKGCSDETADRHHVGKFGRITAFDPDTCGSSESDPFLIVDFIEGGSDGFWLEELSVHRG